MSARKKAKCEETTTVPHSIMECEHGEEAANTQHFVQPKERRPLSSYTMHYHFESRRTDGRIMAYSWAAPTNEECLQRREQLHKSHNLVIFVCQIWEMESGVKMSDETRVVCELEQICYSLFVTKCEKAMIKVLFAHNGGQNPIVWAMKKYPSSKNIQLCGTWVIVNATYCCQS